MCKNAVSVHRCFLFKTNKKSFEVVLRCMAAQCPGRKANETSVWSTVAEKGSESHACLLHCMEEPCFRKQRVKKDGAPCSGAIIDEKDHKQLDSMEKLYQRKIVGQRYRAPLVEFN